MRMAAGISFRVKWPHDCIIVTDIAHFTPILTPCTLLTTIVLLIDVIKVIDATIFSACLVPRKLRASGAKPQRRRPENFGIELKCDLLQRRKRTRALAYALMRAAERRTPCEQQTDSTRHVRVLFAAGDTPHEVFSLLLSTSDAPSEFRSSAQRQQLRRPCDSFWFLFAFFAAGAAGSKFSRPSAKGRGGACTVLELARSAASGVGAGRHPPCPAGAAHGAAGGIFSRWQRRRPIWWSGRGSGSKMPILVLTCYSEISSRGAFWYMGSGVNSAI